MKNKRTYAAVPWGHLLIAALLALAGSIMLIFPAESAEWAVRTVGILTLLIFIIRSVCDISAFVHGKKTLLQGLMVLGDVLALICGGIFIFNPDGVLLYLFSLIGLYLVIDGSFKLQTTFTLRHYKMFTTWVVLPFAAADILLGYVLIKTVSDNLRLNIILLGVGLIIDAFGHLVSLIVMPAINARRAKEYMEGTFAEDSEPQGEAVQAEDAQDTDVCEE